MDEAMVPGRGAWGQALGPWQEQVLARLGAPPLRFARAEDQLLAEVLRIHGLLLGHLARFDGVPQPLAALDGGLTPAGLAEEIRQAEAAARAEGVDLPLPRLVERFCLTPEERDVLLLAVARAVAPGTGQLVAAAHGAPERDIPSVALALALRSGDPLLTPPVPRLFGQDGRLVREGLIHLVVPTGRPTDLLIDRLIVPGNAVVSLLAGHMDVAEPLVGVAELVRAPRTLLHLVAEEEVQRRLEEIAIALDRYLALPDAGEGESDGTPRLGGVLALLTGPVGCGKSMAAEAVAGTAGRPLLRVSAAQLAAAREPSALLDAVFAQASLFDAVICLRGAEVLFAEARAPLETLLTRSRRHRGLTLLTTSEPGRLAPELGPHLVFEVELPRPDAALREQMWEAHLPPDVALAGAPRLNALAWQYELTGSQVRNAVVSAYFKAATRRRGPIAIGGDDLDAAAREQLATRLEGVVARRGSKQRLDAIVLPEDTERSVREFLDACRHRTAVLNEWGFGRRLSTGKGIVALFDGEPGTGKTYCAELLANELGLVLQVVAIPHVISKWVGETEKNIERLFSHARAQNTLLMFDEADSLFGTRVKVERSMDRFSNMEVNQLLQEIDRFEGIVILTTNLESSMDRAFKRRVGFHVKFPLPDARVRAGIWRVLVPPEAPLADDVDFEDLAERFELPGGHIKNILVRAAYRARARGEILTMDLLEAVAEDECRAAGKLFRRAGAGFSES